MSHCILVGVLTIVTILFVLALVDIIPSPFKKTKITHITLSKNDPQYFNNLSNAVSEGYVITADTADGNTELSYKPQYL